VTGVPLKRSVLILASTLLLALTVSCGGGGTTYNCINSSGNKITTKTKSDCNYPPDRVTSYTYIKNRIFVTNNVADMVNIVDGDTDLISTTSFTVGNAPTWLSISPDQKNTFAYNSTDQSVTSIYNPSEKIVSNVSLGGDTEVLVPAPDNQHFYTAVRSYQNYDGVYGVVEIIDFTIPGVQQMVEVPSAHWLSLSHDGKRLLAMSDNRDDIYSIDPTATTATATKLSVTGGSFSRPIAAYFSSDDTKAYIISCGPECGGTQAGVQELTFATGVVRSINTAVGRASTLDGTNLYLSGAPSGSSAYGLVQKVDLSAFAAGPAVSIGHGNHNYIKFAGGKVWVGATNCGSVTGCLNIWDPSTTSAITVAAKNADGSLMGDVTGFTWLTARKLMYVAQGGQLYIYDATGKTVTPLSKDYLTTDKYTNFNIIGKAWDLIPIPNQP